MRLTIPDHRPVSWNRLYSQQHWTKRKALADEVHLLTLAAIPPDAEMVKGPVWIFITAHNRKPLDPDNICAKLYVDALKGRVIADDDPRYVRGVALRSETGDPKVEIVIQETYEEEIAHGCMVIAGRPDSSGTRHAGAGGHVTGHNSRVRRSHG